MTTTRTTSSRFSSTPSTATSSGSARDALDLMRAAWEKAGRPGPDHAQLVLVPHTVVRECDRPDVKAAA